MERSCDYAASLAGEGVKPGDVVILILHHGKELVYSFWGAILLGAVPSIMPFPTDKVTPERYVADLQALFSLCRPTAVITSLAFEPICQRLVAIEGQEGGNVGIIFVERIAVQDELDTSNLPGTNRQETEIALLQHSSGSTGLKKGVALSHRAIYNSVDSWAEYLALTPSDVFISWAPLYHDMGLICSFLLPILHDVHTVMMSPFEWVREPWRLLRAISDYHGTLTIQPNFAYNFCANKIRERDIEGVDLSSLRVAINGSEPVYFKSHQLFYERFKSHGFRLEALKTAYGMAENVLIATQTGLDEIPTVEEIDFDTYMSDHLARPAIPGRPSIQMMSSGRPLSHVQIRVVDAKGKDLPERHIGEIVVKSNCMLTEYYHRPDLTKKAFLPGDWYISGDYGYLDKGEIFVSGRKNDRIIVAGKNVYPQDLEMLAEEVPGVHPGRTAAISLYEESLGTEMAVILAEVETTDKELQERLADEIRDHVTANSAVAIRCVQIVERGWILKSSAGKIARSANKNKYIQEFNAGQETIT